LSVNGFSLNSGYTLDTNAMDLPSGAQIPWLAPVLMFVSGIGSRPARSVTYSWFFDSNRMDLPSGDHRGFAAFMSFGESCFGVFFPSVAATHNAVLLVFFSRSTLVT